MISYYEEISLRLLYKARDPERVYYWYSFLEFDPCDIKNISLQIVKNVNSYPEPQRTRHITNWLTEFMNSQFRDKLKNI
jgi:hypothetical protein